MAIANYSKTCAANRPGNSTLWITEKSNISSVTFSGGEVTAMTMTTSGTFKTVAIDQDTLERVEEGKGSKTGNISYKHQIKFKLSKLATAMNTFRNALAEASICGMVGLIKDGNGTWWVVGYNESDLGERPLRLMTNNSKSGVTPQDEDAANAEIVLETDSGYPAYPVASGKTVAVTGIS